MAGRLSMNRWNGHLLGPLHLCQRSPQCSIVDPPACRRYLSHCVPSIATDAVSNEIRRLAYMGPVTVMISLGGSSWAGKATEFPPVMAD